VKYDNVVPFDPSHRGGMARRGAPDKSASDRTQAEAIVMDCPTCACELRLEPEWLEGLTEVLCGRCETEIGLVLFRKRREASS
jgi:hypothetical protein